MWWPSAPVFRLKSGLDAFPGESIAGTVTDVATVPGTFDKDRDVTYVVTISLEDDAGDLPMRWGMTAEINIDTD